MNWIDILWPMVSAACLMLGLIHFLVWLNDRSMRDHLMFSVAAASVASLAILELLMMRATSVADYASYLLAADVAVVVMIVALVLFVNERFHAGSMLLLQLILISRALCFVLGFTTGVALDYTHITALEPVEVPGAGLVMMPIGEINPWLMVDTLSNVMFIVYLLSVIRDVVRRGNPVERNAALKICGSMLLFLVIAGGGTRLVTGGQIQGPLIVSLAFAGVMIVISQEIGGEILRAARIRGELEHSQSDLRESEQQMQLAAQTAGLGLWSWDLGSNEISFTDAVSRLFGLEPGQRITGESMLSRVHPEDRATVEKERARAMEKGVGFACDFRVLSADGRTRWIVSKGIVQRLPGNDGAVIRGLMLDRTERWQAAERFRQVVEGAPIAMVMVDDTGHITLANARTERVFGYARDELQGLSLNVLVPKICSIRLLMTDDANPSSTGATPSQPLTGIRKDASEIFVEVQRTEINVDDKPFDLVSIIDTSDRLRAEQEAAMQREELAHLARVALLGELSGSLAHELNQPLTAILSNAQAALRFLDHKPPNLAEMRESLVEIVESDKRANEVIRRLRAMLRKERTDYQWVDINEIVVEVFKLINSDILNRRVVAYLELGHELPMVNADRIQLQQVLLNLVINACDSMSDSESARTLTVRTRSGPDNGIHVELVDSGTGIPEADLEQIFKPFITTKSQGIGIGLSICETIIHHHGGRLWATNNPARGATLHFALPAINAGPGGP